MNKHEITLLSRKVMNDPEVWAYFNSLLLILAQEASAGNSTPGITWRVIKYNEKNDLVERRGPAWDLYRSVFCEPALGRSREQFPEEPDRCFHHCWREKFCSKRVWLVSHR